MPDRDVTKRIRRIFLHQRPHVTIAEATVLLGWSRGEMSRAIADGEIEVNTTEEQAARGRALQLLHARAEAPVGGGSGKLANELERLDLIDEYQFLVHPRIAGHGPTLYQSGLPGIHQARE